MPLAYDATCRRRRDGPPPPRTSIEVFHELFRVCESAHAHPVADARRLIDELGTLFNPNAHRVGHSIPFAPIRHTSVCNRHETLLLNTISGDSHPEVSTNRLAIVRLLLDAGADPNLGAHRKVDFYTPGEDDYEPTPAFEDCWRHQTPLNDAILGGDYDIVHALLAAGADPNAPTRCDRATPPIMAFEFERHCFPRVFPEILEELLAFGADINSRDGHGETLLLRLFKPRSKAESTPPTAIVRAVLQAGANPNLGDRTGALPLHYAVALGDPALVQLLLQAGANPNAAPPAQTPAEREAHLCNYFHPSYVRARKNKWLRVEHGVRFPYAQPDHAIAKVEHHELRCFRETPWQLATLISYHHKFELDVLGERASPICRSARRVESLLRQNRAWRKLRAFCRLRHQLFNLYELVCTPDRIDVAAELAAATEGLYAT